MIWVRVAKMCRQTTTSATSMIAIPYPPHPVCVLPWSTSRAVDVPSAYHYSIPWGTVIEDEFERFMAMPGVKLFTIEHAPACAISLRDGHRRRRCTLPSNSLT